LHHVLTTARYLKDCQQFEKLGGKPKYRQLLGRPYSVQVGVKQEMIAMLKAASDMSVDGVDLNDARKKAFNVGIHRLQKVASAPIQLLGDVFRSQLIHGAEVDAEVLIAPLLSVPGASHAILVAQAKRRIERGIEVFQEPQQRPVRRCGKDPRGAEG
jgi:hypothetical protein